MILHLDIYCTSPSLDARFPSFNFQTNRGAIAPATAIIAVLGALSAYTFVLLGRSCAETNADSYEQSWAKTVGEKSAWLPATSCVATCFAGCLAYTIIIGDSFSALAKTFGAPAMVANRSNIIMALSTTVLLPLSLLKSESSFLVCMLINILCLVVVVVMVVAVSNLLFSPCNFAVGTVNRRYFC